MPMSTEHTPFNLIDGLRTTTTTLDSTTPLVPGAESTTTSTPSPSATPSISNTRIFSNLTCDCLEAFGVRLLHFYSPPVCPPCRH